MLVEAYVDQLATAIEAERNGAGRLELCGPGEGGLTPSAQLIAEVMGAVRIPIHAMTRPREGDFVYSAAEFATMKDEVRMIRAAGCAGVVLGISNPDGTLDVARMAELVALARPMRVGIHRAFDRAPDGDAALEQCLGLGIDVILAAGHATSAEQGIANLARYVKRAGAACAVMPGGGVRAHNVARIVRETGAREVHARASDPATFADLVRAAHAIGARR